MGKKKRVAVYELKPSIEGIDELERDVSRLASLVEEAGAVIERIRGSRITLGIDATPCKPGRK